MSMPGDDRSKDEAMNDSYLWEGSGEANSEVRNLEALLGELRHSGAPLVFPPEVAVEHAKPRSLLLQMPWIPRIAAAIIVAIALGISLFLSRSPTVAQKSWDVACLQGEVQVGNAYIRANQANGKLNVGQVLETDQSSRASISESSFGQIDVEPASRVRLEQFADNRARIELDRGTIHAAIWAPPGRFVVDTPSAVAVDLGCAYTLQIFPDGSGSIRTTLGWVGFHLNGRESFIPAGAMCSTRTHIGPGTPYFEDAPAAFRAALADFDFNGESRESRASALAIVLAQARAKDGLSLWHLLSRTGGVERAQVYDRFSILVPPPDGVTREGIFHLDQSMLDLWWSSLDLGDISIWRLWEQSTSPQGKPGAGAMREKRSTPEPAR